MANYEVSILVPINKNVPSPKFKTTSFFRVASSASPSTLTKKEPIMFKRLELSNLFSRTSMKVYVVSTSYL